MRPELPDTLPPVPPPVMIAPPDGRRVPLQRPPVASGPEKTLFDAAPAGTVAARAAIEKARANLQAAVRAVAAAKKSAEELGKLIAENPAAAVIAEHEGISPALIKQFHKLADPFLAAFTVAPTPPPAA